tara:strand:- start:26284 stop:28707 length:2424 start_codon:yes stop_codon:yes gene_type:complete
MGGIGSILIIILMVLVAIILNKISTLGSKIEVQNYLIKSQFEQLTKLLQKQTIVEKEVEPAKEVVPEPPIPQQSEPIIVPVTNATPAPEKEETSSTEKETVTEPSEQVITPVYEGQIIHGDTKTNGKPYPYYPTDEPTKEKTQKATRPVEPPKPPRPTFMERNPDLETFIGENLLSKIGIVIFVIGMGFLVKLGIDSGVISEGMRVAIGVLIGGGMVGLAFYLRKSFATFSSVLIGGALAVLYFTIAIAFHEYHIIPQAAAFGIMVAITAFGVLLAIAFDRKELAVLAIIGGFGTPFFISTGSGNFRVLLSYILILDIGMLALVYFKKWNIINYLAYGFSYLLFIGVYSTKFIENEDAFRLPMFLFLTAFYLIFFLMTIIYNVKNNYTFKLPEISILLSNSAIYFGLGLALVHGYENGLYSGLFTALIAIFNLGFTLVLYKRKSIDTNLLFLLIGLVLTFVSLIAPIQLQGNYITLFWAIESVLLLWLSQKSGIKLMKAAFGLVLLLMLGSLLLDWNKYYDTYLEVLNLRIFINQVFITTLVAIGALFGITKLLKNETAEAIVPGVSIRDLSKIIPLLMVSVLFIGLMLELNYQFIRAEFSPTLQFIAMGCYFFSYLLALIGFTKWKKYTVATPFLNLATLFSIGAYLSLFSVQISNARNLYLLGQPGLETGFTLHYLLLALFTILTVILSKNVYTQYGYKSNVGEKSLWVLAFIGVFVASSEIGHIAAIYQYHPEAFMNDLYSNIYKSVYPVVWGVSALILMILGMKFKLKTLRIISLSLFLLTIIKLFLYDLQGNTTVKLYRSYF